MSTRWHIHCLRCAESRTITGTGNEALTRPRISELAAAGNGDAVWLAQHAAHRLVPVTEYGAVVAC